MLFSCRSKVWNHFEGLICLHTPTNIHIVYRLIEQDCSCICELFFVFKSQVEERSWEVPLPGGGEAVMTKQQYRVYFFSSATTLKMEPCRSADKSRLPCSFFLITYWNLFRRLIQTSCLFEEINLSCLPRADMTGAKLVLFGHEWQVHQWAVKVVSISMALQHLIPSLFP